MKEASNGNGAKLPDLLERVQYREYKILLRPERFHGPESFSEFWKLARHTLKELEIEVSKDEDADKQRIREVLLYDTANFDLYRNAFILRKRTFYKKGWLEHDHELTIKFRHPKVETAAAVDVRSSLEGGKVKLKEEVLLSEKELGGMRNIFSHSCEVVSSEFVLDRELAHVANLFPVLRKLEVQPKSQMELVNRVAVEEVLLHLGELHFGAEMKARATIAVWRNRATQHPLVGEFGFSCKFPRYSDFHRKPKEASEKFYKQVQIKARDWILPVTTKTALIYGLGDSIKTA